MEIRKRGAIELSMSTIIVIIIGITLLSLGLIWVRETFSKITKTSESAFEQTDAVIEELYIDVDKLLNVRPGSIDIKQNGDGNVNVIIANLGNEEIDVHAEVESMNEKIECLFADTINTSTKQYKIESGEQVSIKLIVSEMGGNLGIKVCNLVIPEVTTGDNQDSLMINVKK